METVNRIWNSSVYGPSDCAVLTVTGQAMYVSIYATFSRITTVVRQSEYITYSEYVSVAFVIQHAMRMRRTILSSAACLVLPYFPTLSHKRQDFRQKLWNATYVLIFSANFV
jgi:hypothetical protein